MKRPLKSNYYTLYSLLSLYSLLHRRDVEFDAESGVGSCDVDGGLFAKEDGHSLTDIFQADAGAFLILGGGGMGWDGVFGNEGEVLAFLVERQVDVGVGLVAYTAVFEAVLHHRLEHHRGNHVGGILNLAIELNVGFLLHANQAEVDEVVDVGNLLLEGDTIRLAIVGHVTEHLAQLHHRVGRLLVLQEGKGIDAVEGIEEEVRIDLRLEVLQLQLCAALALQLVEAFPFVEQPGDGGDGHGDEQEDDVLGVKPIALILTSLNGGFHLGRMAEHLSFDEFGDEEQVRFGGHDRDDNEQKQAGEVEDPLVAMQSLWRKLVLDEGPYKQHRDDGHVGDDHGRKSCLVGGGRNPEDGIDAHPTEEGRILLDEG